MGSNPIRRYETWNVLKLTLVRQVLGSLNCPHALLVYWMVHLTLPT